MLNHRILLGILVFISTNVLADECTKYVEAYASGFEMIAGMDGGDSNKAEIELDRIRSFQNKMPDCKVVQQIPAPDFDTFFTKPLILLESKNKLGTTLKVSVDYLIR